MIRAVWVDEGNDANYAKLKAIGAVPCFAIRDPRVDLAYLTMVKAKGFDSVGVYVVASWYKLTAAKFATLVSSELTRIAPQTPPGFPFVCVDMEGKTGTVKPGLPDYQISFMRQWRKHRPDRVTDMTIEGHQGGLYNEGAADWLGRQVRYMVPQCYNAAMTQVWDSFAMALDLCTAGFKVEGIRPFYDAAHLPEWWDGYAFTQGRLP